uniref:G-protein coupled receptors family 2 profile 1 domain-containing protein n=1 Tax=Seriola lalandi dorsalis TaxID=1841481 RepID=A0A3B4WNI4_SERLL
MALIFSYSSFPVGLFCNRTFDRYACWPDTPAGSMVNISCPFYLPWYDKGKSHF